MSKFLIRPGSILVILIIGAVLGGMINWAENSMSRSKNATFEDQRQAIECSELRVDFVDQNFNGTHQSVFLQVNKNVDSLLVHFQGSRNVTRVKENVNTNSVIQVKAPMKSVSEINARVEGCDRVFG